MTESISQKEFDKMMQTLNRFRANSEKEAMAEMRKNNERNRKLYEKIATEGAIYRQAKENAKIFYKIEPADPAKKAMRKIYSLQRHLKHTIADFFPDRTLTDEELMVQFSETEESVLFNIVIKKANGNVQ